MKNTRRDFLKSAAYVTAGFAGLAIFANQGWAGRIDGYGTPQKDPEGILDLPRGFKYHVISKSGRQMTDGFVVPRATDGMGAFKGDKGRTILVRNHEVKPDVSRQEGPFGDQNRLLGRLDPGYLYDAGSKPGRPTLGGCTTLIYDHGTGRVDREYLSLAGTLRNCAGGPTPWGTWLSCEETVDIAGKSLARDHGYVFEVPASEKVGLTRPQPLKALGRFNHEAVAVDPKTGFVYLTEDRPDGLIYRFIPRRLGRLAEGGKLQALAIAARAKFDTRNWETRMVPAGVPIGVKWIDVDPVDTKKDDLRKRGTDDGAAIFARGEGIWYGGGSIYWACTNGGKAQKGQIWKYTPSPDEGRTSEIRKQGQLELFIEPNDATLVDNCDNVTISPRSGDLFVCEDNDDRRDTNNIVGVTPDGEAFVFAHNAFNNSEFAGACFSPDGSTLFVNIYDPGLTLAITGGFRSA